jgi:hypothetical protein
MAGLCSDVDIKFCELCSWTHEVWQFHRALFDDNPPEGNAALRRHEYSLHRLSIITQEYSLHQLAKLHDPAIQGKSINLGIEYVIEFGAWDSPTLADLRRLKTELETLAARIRGGDIARQPGRARGCVARAVRLDILDRQLWATAPRAGLHVWPDSLAANGVPR